MSKKNPVTSRLSFIVSTTQNWQITLLPKPDKDLTQLTNWRPISLLNADYKILVKTIANRIKQVLNKLIDQSHTGFVKNRFIGENIRILHDIISYTYESNIPGILVLTDFEKAFDSIDHNFIHRTLESFNFGESIKSWIKILYQSPTSCVSNNGSISDSFHIGRGVRQGCPLSPYIFILSIELLSIGIRNNTEIKGISIFDKMIKNVMFADDATIVLDGTEKRFNKTLNVFEEFGKISGLKLNYQKCVALKLGSLRNQHDLIC